MDSRYVKVKNTLYSLRPRCHRAKGALWRAGRRLGIPVAWLPLWDDEKERRLFLFFQNA